MVQAARVVLLVSRCLKAVLFSEPSPSEHGTEDFRVLGEDLLDTKRNLPLVSEVTVTFQWKRKSAHSLRRGFDRRQKIPVQCMINGMFFFFFSFIHSFFAED